MQMTFEPYLSTSIYSGQRAIICIEYLQNRQLRAIHSYNDTLTIKKTKFSTCFLGLEIIGITI